MFDASDGSAPQAVLFDMDGTLVDTEGLWTIALAELAGRLGGPLRPAVRTAITGTTTATSIRLLLDDLGVAGDVDALGAALERRTRELFEDGLTWRAGARELLHDVRAAGLPTGLVTATRRPLVEVALRTLGTFDVLVTGDDVTHPKPHPEPYLRAAALLGVDPSRCVAIEDSVTGAAAAAGAGCRVLVVPSEQATDAHGGPGRTVHPTLAGLTARDLSYL